MEKIYLVMWISTLLILLFISLLLFKIFSKLYEKERTERKAKEDVRKKERAEINAHRLQLSQCHKMTFFEKIIFQTNFIPGFDIDKTPILEEES